MTDYFVFILIFVISLKTFFYGIQTAKNKNISGGIFVFLLSLSSLSLGAYLLLFGGA